MVLPAMSSYIRLAESDVKSFLRPSQSTRPHGTRLVVPVSVIALLTAGILAVNSIGGASVELEGSPNLTPVTIAQAAPQHQSQAVAGITAANSAPTPIVSSAPAEALSIPNNTVAYDRFSISAPVSWDASFGSPEVYEALKHGVVHLDGTAKPGQQGAVVVFGHSSDLPWRSGSYKTVFAPIVKSSKGDRIQIAYNGVMYTYQVTKTYEVAADQVEILSSNSAGMLRLVTCTPIGTNLRRFVVEAEQISPSPAANTAFTATPFGDNLLGDL
jgi:LPXTG-site transpeptidase (sortase) family protein